ncbi:MAG: hypothetical protein AAF721_06790 [Myxococcota bacterium]
MVHAGSTKVRPEVHLDDLNYEDRKFNNFVAYGEAKVATTLYAMELAERTRGTGSPRPRFARAGRAPTSGAVADS